MEAAFSVSLGLKDFHNALIISSNSDGFVRFERIFGIKSCNLIGRRVLKTTTMISLRNMNVKGQKERTTL